MMLKAFMLVSTLYLELPDNKFEMEGLKPINAESRTALPYVQH